MVARPAHPRRPGDANLLGWAEVMLRALDGTGLNHRDNLGCVLLLDGFVRSHAGLMRHLVARDATPVQAERVGRFLLPRLRAKPYPMLAELYAGLQDEVDDLEFGLTRLLDGIQVLTDRVNS